MIAIGKWYEYGESGFPRDLQQAYYWYEKAAYSGDGEGQAEAGAFLTWGFGVPRDTNSGIHLLHLAAGSGSANACRSLGDYYKSLRDDMYFCNVNSADNDLKTGLHVAKYWYNKALDESCVWPLDKIDLNYVKADLLEVETQELTRSIDDMLEASFEN